MQAFDTIMRETEYTKQILTLNLGGTDSEITFWDDRSKLSQEACQKCVNKYLTRRRVQNDDRMMHAVKVQMMEIRWLNMGNKTFLDLVEILNETSNKAIFHTAFVTGLLSGYWDRYFQLILKTQFYPFLAYLVCMISWYVYAL